MLSYNKTKFDGQEPNLGVRLRQVYLKSIEDRQYFELATRFKVWDNFKQWDASEHDRRINQAHYY